MTALGDRLSHGVEITTCSAYGPIGHASSDDPTHHHDSAGYRISTQSEGERDARKSNSLMPSVFHQTPGAAGNSSASGHPEQLAHWCG